MAVMLAARAGILWWLLAVGGVVAVVAATRGLVLLVAVVGLWRWLTGQRLGRGGYLPARFMLAVAPPSVPPRRFGLPRVHWRCWPGWQRMLVRWVATVVAVVAVWRPVGTAVVLAVGVVSVSVAAVVTRHRARIRARVLRVPASVYATPTPRPALTAGTAAAAGWRLRGRAGSSTAGRW